MRSIRESDFRFVDDEIQFHGAARRMLERMARRHTREGRTVTGREIAEALTRSLQEAAVVQSHIVRAINKLRRLIDQDGGRR